MKRRPAPAGRRDEGFATVLAVAVLGVLLAVTGSALLVAAAATARHRAATAADLSALAGAGAPLGADACALAARVAADNGAAVATCDQEAGGAVRVTVSVPVPLLGRAVTAVARAGR
ncbi:secretion/DNA translocation related TadE-like protein [Motilibacter peucedani]|uniref:Secretion/DNA translocation related TadE-like protein n=1 Tax=Motilibacter peucedani TaxID=598650 RepID=A0A420XQ33_9ACTN|nr:Rv3654c family TadE-like protein [Motilibacter peucedani]RKS75355.1 secretion/DNA translocation related TadE-like protein [Motilibacter peucedani]